ncbi:SDR family oxidoreductase [Pseudomonas sp. CFBP 8772]|uniref:SDR family oxidoreductase n=1 Tax=Pseudomonas sp. CFBP 8772 TaxID=2775284 RepID=UPI0017819A6E|nr:SDR family oxidoreductase [Pseudomonas sp. CFBP 8772]MBD8598402.1 SDR family oxidoreductase [Pseudomonas sp. CFBP 8772]
MSVVLITGCSSGIGRAMANTFKAAGHDVWTTARKPADVQALTLAGFRAVALDVNDSAAIDRLVSELDQHGKGLDVLINNAGYGGIGPLLDGCVDAMRRQFETNVFSVVGVTRALFPMLRRNKGLVVNIGSVSGVLVTPFAGAYCASKAAVHAMTEALRMELAPFGIRVMEVQPGAIDTHFAQNASHEAEQVIHQDSPWWPWREGIRARANASQGNPTPAADFARDVLDAVQRSHPPRLLRSGNGSRALPLMERLLPKALLEWILSKRFKLDKKG